MAKKVKSNKVKDKLTIPKGLPFGIQSQPFSNIYAGDVRWTKGVPGLEWAANEEQGVNVSGINLSKNFNLGKNLNLNLSNPALIYANPKINNKGYGHSFKPLPFQPKASLTYNFKNGGPIDPPKKRIKVGGTSITIPNINSNLSYAAIPAAWVGGLVQGMANKKNKFEESPKGIIKQNPRKVTASYRYGGPKYPSAPYYPYKGSTLRVNKSYDKNHVQPSVFNHGGPGPHPKDTPVESDMSTKFIRGALNTILPTNASQLGAAFLTGDSKFGLEDSSKGEQLALYKSIVNAHKRNKEKAGLQSTEYIDYNKAMDTDLQHLRGSMPSILGGSALSDEFNAATTYGRVSYEHDPETNSFKVYDNYDFTTTPALDSKYAQLRNAVGNAAQDGPLAPTKEKGNYLGSFSVDEWDEKKSSILDVPYSTISNASKEVEKTAKPLLNQAKKEYSQIYPTINNAINTVKSQTNKIKNQVNNIINKTNSSVNYATNKAKSLYPFDYGGHIHPHPENPPVKKQRTWEEEQALGDAYMLSKEQNAAALKALQEEQIRVKGVRENAYNIASNLSKSKNPENSLVGIKPTNAGNFCNAYSNSVYCQAGATTVEDINFPNYWGKGKDRFIPAGSKHPQIAGNLAEQGKLDEEGFVPISLDKIKKGDRLKKEMYVKRVPWQKSGSTNPSWKPGHAAIYGGVDEKGNPIALDSNGSPLNFSERGWHYPWDSRGDTSTYNPESDSGVDIRTKAYRYVGNTPSLQKTVTNTPVLEKPTLTAKTPTKPIQGLENLNSIPNIKLTPEQTAAQYFSNNTIPSFKYGGCIGKKYKNGGSCGCSKCGSNKLLTSSNTINMANFKRKYNKGGTILPSNEMPNVNSLSVPSLSEQIMGLSPEAIGDKEVPKDLKELGIGKKEFTNFFAQSKLAKNWKGDDVAENPYMAKNAFIAMQALSDYGFNPDKPTQITGTYRPPKVNKANTGAKKSDHLMANAADVRIGDPLIDFIKTDSGKQWLKDYDIFYKDETNRVKTRNAKGKATSYYDPHHHFSFRFKDDKEAKRKLKNYNLYEKMYNLHKDKETGFVDMKDMYSNYADESIEDYRTSKITNKPVQNISQNMREDIINPMEISRNSLASILPNNQFNMGGYMKYANGAELETDPPFTKEQFQTAMGSADMSLGVKPFNTSEQYQYYTGNPYKGDRTPFDKGMTALATTGIGAAFGAGTTALNYQNKYMPAHRQQYDNYIADRNAMGSSWADPNKQLSFDEYLDFYHSGQGDFKKQKRQDIGIGALMGSVPGVLASFAVNKGLDKLRTKKNNKQKENLKSAKALGEPTDKEILEFRNQQKHGGYMQYANGGQFDTGGQMGEFSGVPVTEFNGNTHEQGGIPQGPTAEVEDGELKLDLPNGEQFIVSPKIMYKKNDKEVAAIAQELGIGEKEFKRFAGKDMVSVFKSLTRKNSFNGEKREGDTIQENSIEADIMPFVELHTFLTERKNAEEAAKKEQAFAQDMDMMMQEHPEYMQAMMAQQQQQQAPQQQQGPSPEEQAMMEQQMMQQQGGAPQGMPPMMGTYGGKMNPDGSVIHFNNGGYSYSDYLAPQQAMPVQGVAASSYAQGGQMQQAPQQGGQEQEIMGQVAQALQQGIAQGIEQGMSQEEATQQVAQGILGQLVESGMPEEQAGGLIQGVMQQLQGGQQGQPMATGGMMPKQYKYGAGMKVAGNILSKGAPLLALTGIPGLSAAGATIGTGLTEAGTQKAENPDEKPNWQDIAAKSLVSAGASFIPGVGGMVDSIGNKLYDETLDSSKKSQAEIQEILNNREHPEYEKTLKRMQKSTKSNKGADLTNNIIDTGMQVAGGIASNQANTAASNVEGMDAFAAAGGAPEGTTTGYSGGTFSGANDMSNYSSYAPGFTAGAGGTAVPVSAGGGNANGGYMQYMNGGVMKYTDGGPVLSLSDDEDIDLSQDVINKIRSAQGQEELAPNIDSYMHHMDADYYNPTYRNYREQLEQALKDKQKIGDTTDPNWFSNLTQQETNALMSGAPYIIAKDGKKYNNPNPDPNTWASTIKSDPMMAQFANNNFNNYNTNIQDLPKGDVEKQDSVLDLQSNPFGFSNPEDSDSEIPKSEMTLIDEEDPTLGRNVINKIKGLEKVTPRPAAKIDATTEEPELRELPKKETSDFYEEMMKKLNAQYTGQKDKYLKPSLMNTLMGAAPGIFDVARSLEKPDTLDVKQLERVPIRSVDYSQSRKDAKELLAQQQKNLKNYSGGQGNYLSNMLASQGNYQKYLAGVSEAQANKNAEIASAADARNTGIDAQNAQLNMRKQIYDAQSKEATRNLAGSGLGHFADMYAANQQNKFFTEAYAPLVAPDYAPNLKWKRDPNKKWWQ